MTKNGMIIPEKASVLGETARVHTDFLAPTTRCHDVRLHVQHYILGKSLRVCPWHC